MSRLSLNPDLGIIDWIEFLEEHPTPSKDQGLPGLRKFAARHSITLIPWAARIEAIETKILLREVHNS